MHFKVSQIIIISLCYIGIACLAIVVYKQHLNQQAALVLMENIKSEATTKKNTPSTELSKDTNLSMRWSDVQSKTHDTVVQIFSQIAEFNWLEPYRTPHQFIATGSGFFISKNGDIITNAHVVDQARAVSIQIPSLGKRRFDAQVIGVSPERDLALIRLFPNELQEVLSTLPTLPILTLGNSDFINRADDIMALGYPLGQQSLKSTTGVVSGREHVAGQHMVQTSAPINPGSSGGPSLNTRGEVIGVNSSGIREAQNVGYFIPSNEVKLFLKQLEQLPGNDTIKFLRKPFLGIFFNNASDTLTKFLNNPLPGGLYVVDTYKGSPLKKAGITSSDMIYEIDGHRIDIFGELNLPWSEDKISIIDYVSRLMVGDNVHLIVYRQGKRKEFNFAFGTSELPPVRRMHPGYEPIDYQVIGGLVVMQLSLNHLPLLVQAAPELARYMELKNQLQGALVITHVLPDSAAYRSRSIGIGAVLAEVNDVPVTTLNEFRQALLISLRTNFLTIKTRESVFSVLPFDKVLAQETKLSGIYYYPLSPEVKQWITSSAQQQAPSTPPTGETTAISRRSM
jgi:serine protease Do